MKEGKDIIKNMLKKYLKSYHDQKEMLYSLDDYTSNWSGYGLRF